MLHPMHHLVQLVNQRDDIEPLKTPIRCKFLVLRQEQLVALGALFRTSALLHVLRGEGVLGGVRELLPPDRDELVEGLWRHSLLHEAQDRQAALLVLLHEQPDMLDQFHGVGQVGSRREHPLEVLEEQHRRVLLQHVPVLADEVGEELELHRRHQVLARLVLLQVLDELVEERVHHDVFGHVVVLSEDFLEPAKDHFSRNLVDLFVA